MTNLVDDKAIEGVLLDMDGVLCESSPYLMETATRLFQDKYQVQVTREDFTAFAGSGETSYLVGIANRYGVNLDMPADKDTLYAMYLEAIQGRLSPLPGVLDFIKRCRSKMLPIAVATSAEKIKFDGNLKQMGISINLFDAFVTGNDVTQPKPDPAIFKLAARRLGLFPEECLVVEDAPNGITAALHAGCRCLAVTTTFDEATLREAGAQWVVPDLSNVELDLVAGQPLLGA